MSTTALVVVSFGDCHVNFRRHWGGDPVLVGSEMLDLLASAETIKPRPHFHTGSWLLRLMFSDSDGGKLPTYEAYVTNDGAYGDWEKAYQFRLDDGDNWQIGYVAECDGEPWDEIADRAQWFNPDEFRDFIDRKFAEDKSHGVTYDVELRGPLGRHKRE